MNKTSTLYTITLACALFFTACSGEKSDTAGARPPAQVEVALPEKRMVETWDSFTARSRGEKSVDIRARVNGYLEKVCFRDGEYVKAGEALFIIDARPFEAVVRECEAKVKEAETRIVLAKSNLNRAEELIKTNAISSEVLETRRCEAATAEALLMSAQATLREAALNLEFTKITAPISGFVSKRLVDEGNLINASQTSLATIVSRDVIYADFFISERDIIRFSRNGLFKKVEKPAGQKPIVKMKLRDDDPEEYIGELTYIQNSTEWGNLELRAEFQNKEHTFLPGIMAKVYLQSEEAREKLLVPEAAIGTDLVGRYVLTIDQSNKVKVVPVLVGEVQKDGMQIVEKGLDGNERIVVNGIQRAIPNTIVSPVSKQAK